MYRRILVPLDGSPAAEGIAPYVGLLARRLRLPVELLTVVVRTDLEASAPTDLQEARRYRRRVVSRARRYLQRIARRIGPVPGGVRSVVRVGAAADTIVRRAGRGDTTLLTMTTHGRSEDGGWTLGSVSDKVVHAASCPVLLIGGPDVRSLPGDTSLETLVVPLDGSTLAESALPYVLELAKPLNLGVVLIWVTPSAAQVQAALQGRTDPDVFFYAAEVTAGSYLEQKAQELRNQGVPSTSWEVLRGEAAEQIVDFTRQIPRALVVIGTHGRSGPRRWALGSVAEKVVRYSGDPVLLVRTPGR